MKKLLVLMLVLGLTTAANAGLITDAAQAAFEFSVNGLPQPPEIWLLPSESVMLDLKLLDGHTTGAIDFTWTLSNNQAELITTGIWLTDAFDMPLMIKGQSAQHVRLAGGQIYMPDLAGPLVLMDNLELHCLEETPVVLEIWMSGSSIIDGETYYGPIGEVLHTLIIHQVPEPMTIVLLGLGGLLLRKRRK